MRTNIPWNQSYAFVTDYPLCETRKNNLSIFKFGNIHGAKELDIYDERGTTTLFSNKYILIDIVGQKKETENIEFSTYA